MPPRRRPPALSRERVLAAAVDRADHEGLSGLTMRALAADLGVEAMSIAAGFSYHLGHRALHSLGSMVPGFAQELFAPADGEEDDQSEEELAGMARVLPHATAMVACELHAADGDLLGWCDSRAEFEFTLDLLLDGLEARRVAQSP